MEPGLRGGSQKVTFRGHNVVLGGDIIIAVDGKPVRDFDALIAYLQVLGTALKKP